MSVSEPAENGPGAGSERMARLARLLPPFWRSNRALRIAAIGLLLGALTSGALTYAAFTGVPPLGDDAETLIVLLNVDLVLLLLLGLFIMRRVVSLWVERKRGSAGARLHSRLVVYFGLLALLPAIVVGAFSLLFFNLGLESWFSDRIRTALNESQAVAQAYLEEHRQNIRADALRIARDFNNDSSVLVPNPQFLGRVLLAQQDLRGLSEAIIFEGISRRVVARAGLTFVLEFEPVPESALREAAQGEVVLLTSQSDDRVRALIRLDNFIDLYLYIGRLVDPTVLSRIQDTQTAVAQFERLETERSDIQLSFTLAFLAVSLLLLFTATWIGLYLANQLSQPISVLIGATERVRGGDLNAQVPESGGDDELALLGRAFNRMTDQLRSQRGELLEANRMLDDRRRFTEAVLFGVSAGVIGLDAEGHIDLPNRAASGLLRLELESLIGNPLAEHVPQMAPLLDEARRARPGQLAQSEIKFTEGAETRTLLVRIVAERDGAVLAGFVVTFDDISELLTAQRKAAWADVARRIAHEIKNPLTPIQLSAERLKRKYLKDIQNDPETFATCTDTIIRHVGDIGRMVDEFSNFARMPAPKMSPQDLSDLCRQCVFLQRNARPNVNFDVSLPGSAVVLNCDGRQISQVITNLLKNAEEAIEGRAEQEPDLPTDFGRISLTMTVEADERIDIVIQDNGVGLPKKDRERLTEPYMTTRAKGTGLGLAIVKKIVEDHGGDLNLADAPDRGAAVTVSLPLRAVAEERESDTEDGRGA